MRRLQIGYEREISFLISLMQFTFLTSDDAGTIGSFINQPTFARNMLYLNTARLKSKRRVW